MATLSASTPNTIQGASARYQQCVDVKVKRSRPKTVTWADNDKLNQVGYFSLLMSIITYCLPCFT